MSVDLTKFGGRPIVPVGAKFGDLKPEEVGFNFGLKRHTSSLVKFSATPDLHQKYPKMAGAWDGSKSVNHVDAVLKNHSGDWKKVEELIHYQPRGTCGGRAGSAALDLVQHILIASGKRAKFFRASHASVYYFARKLYGWVGGGNWRDDGDDGVAGGSVPDALKKYGAAHRDESSDPKWYGDGSDDLACQIVCGMHPQIEAAMLKAASDNLVTDWVRVSDAQQLADGIASGGVGVGSDMRGFTMTRDSDGFCRPSGTWAHYQTRPGVLAKKDYGRAGFAYWQSWGKTTPSGPALKGYPGNCFGVEWSVQDQVVKSGEWAVVFGFPLWELEVTPVVPWIF